MHFLMRHFSLLFANCSFSKTSNVIHVLRLDKYYCQKQLREYFRQLSCYLCNTAQASCNTMNACKRRLLTKALSPHLTQVVIIYSKNEKINKMS